MAIDTPTTNSSHSTTQVVEEKVTIDTPTSGSSHTTSFQTDPAQPNKTVIEEDKLEEQQVEDIEKGFRFKQTIKKVAGFHLLSGILMILAGVAIAFQAGCNATLNRYGGRSFSSVVTFAIGALCCLLFFIFDILVLKTPPPSANNLKSAPWYAWIGGILGSYYVIANILTVPRLGTATVLSIFVCAQIIMACIIDHFGLLGVPKRRYTIWRILASLGLIGCVVVVAKF